MAATYTYPGVYIKEIPSGVRPIAGVSTSNTAFIDFFDRGPINVARRIDGLGDLARVYGGLHTASEASYALQQYFLNGGSTAYAIRVLLEPTAGQTDDDGTVFTASAPSSVALPDDNGVDTITVTATSPGTWGNTLAVGVVHAAAPDTTSFDLTVREYHGEVLVASENFENVNTIAGDASNIVLAVNDVSALITVEVDQADARPASVAGAALQAVADLEATRPALSDAVTIAEADAAARIGELPALEAAVQAAIDASVTTATAGEAGDVGATRDATTAAIEASVVGDATVTAARLAVDAASTAHTDAVTTFAGANQANADALAASQASQEVLDAVAFKDAAAAGIDREIATFEELAVRGEALVAVDNSDQPVVDTATTLRAEVDAAVPALRDAATAAETTPAVVAARADEAAAATALATATSNATVQAEADQTVIDARTAVADQHNVIVAAESALLAAVAALDALDPAIRTAQRNADIDELDDIAQGLLTALTGGSDGVRPGSAVWNTNAAGAITGNPLQKSGMYALDQIAPEIFNIMCVPAAAELDDAGASAVFANALKYCKDKRAFLIVDPPRGFDDPLTVAGWGDLPRDANSAVFFPRIHIGDPLAGNTPRSVASSGTVAGIFARTDADRGVFKAPAGTATSLRGTSLRLTHELTDKQNGVLNTQGINVLRNFPIYNNIAWGARTLVGANAMASEWKYIPVRRTALFIEESLFQGLKWVVFEPNDEPLWGQLRLNVGAFMHGLFRQGAFQGAKPSDAYLVKCDGETTTQNDINAGVVNLVVGFAPLKPAEFVIINIKQLAGKIQA